METQPLTWQVRPSKCAARSMNAQPSTYPSCSSTPSVLTSIDTGKQAWSDPAGTAIRVSADAKASGESWGAGVSLPALGVLRGRGPGAGAAHSAFNATIGRGCGRVAGG